MEIRAISDAQLQIVGCSDARAHAWQRRCRVLRWMRGQVPFMNFQKKKRCRPCARIHRDNRFAKGPEGDFFFTVFLQLL